MRWLAALASLRNYMTAWLCPATDTIGPPHAASVRVRARVSVQTQTMRPSVAPINANGVASRRVGRGTRPTLGPHPNPHPTTTWLWLACPDSSPIDLNSPILLSCPLCASSFNPPTPLNHEGHQRHETEPRNPVPSRGTRPGGATDLLPVRPPTFGRFSRSQRPGTRSGQAAKPRSRQETRPCRSGIPLLPPVRNPPGLISPATPSPQDRPTAPAFFASSRETLSPQSQEDGRKNRKKTQKGAVPIRRNSPPRTLAMACWCP